METALNGFDAFRKLYPRRVAKQAAERAYKRALRQTTPEEILRATQKYAAERQGQDHTFTAHPARWLNAGRYADYDFVPKPDTVSVSGFYADFSSPELAAWERHERATRKAYPRDKRGGWVFPTRWPPNHEQEATG